MSVPALASTALGLLSSLGVGKASSPAAGDGFAASLALRLAEGRSESFSAFLGALSSDKGGDALSALLGQFAGKTDAAGGAMSIPESSGGGLSASGRNLSLFDPESAYRMMTEINRRDQVYKAQFFELNEMKQGLGEMQAAGEGLADRVAGMAAAADGTALTEELTAFVGQYNEWVGRFGDSVGAGGLLAGTQAAEVSLRALRQSIENPFHGAAGGIDGMADIGLEIDARTGRAALDGERLRAALSSNPEGVLAAVGELGEHFARSAGLLVSENNFIPNRLQNLDRAIDFIADNQSSLQAEFGLGDAPRTSAQVTRAVAAYERMLAG